MSAPPPQKYAWASDFSQYVTSMTRGHGYGGEKFWDEEELFLRNRFAEKVSRCLSVGCGLFRELNTLRHISIDEVWGMDNEKDFIEYLKSSQTSVRPAVRIEHADIYSVYIPPEKRFDLVLMIFNTLGFMYDIPLALKKLYDAVVPGGTLMLSFWMEDDLTTQERIRIYTSSENKQARVEYNPFKNLNDIVVCKDGTEIFRSAIFTKPFLEEMVEKNIPGANIEFMDLTVARIMLLHKSSSCP